MKVSINHLATGLILLSSSFLFASCKRDNKKSDAEFFLPQEFIDRGDFYCEASKEAYKAKGYVHSKCDGAGLTSLYSTRCGGVDLSVFQDSTTGKPYRSPTHDCFTTGASKAEYSRDMLLMRMVAAWRHQDLTWVNQIISYGEKNNWVICEAIDLATRIGRCVVSPSLYSILYDMQSRLEGVLPSSLTVSQKDEDAVGLKNDFEAHLEILRIWLEGEVYGAITDNQVSRLKAYAEREYDNALFLAVYAKYSSGDFSNVLKSLERFPADRLPNSSDWSTEYLYQRAMLKNGVTNPDWLPAPEKGEIFSGTDYNFVIYVINGK